MKNQNGITLIALVITIIVLLILAGISIAMLTGENGILTQASSAKITNLRAEADERVKLAVQAMNLEYQTKKVDDATYTPVGSATALTALTDDLTPASDWTLPSAVAAATTLEYKNADYVKANSNKNRIYSITFDATKGTFGYSVTQE